MEVNASDTRNKADAKVVAGIGGKLSNSIKELATNTAVDRDAQGNRKKASPTCLQSSRALLLLVSCLARWTTSSSSVGGTTTTSFQPLVSSDCLALDDNCMAAPQVAWKSSGTEVLFRREVEKGLSGRLPNLLRKQGRVQICLVMDEVDGMSAGDRGGVTELISTIKGSKVPIICICNDKYSTKLRSLRNSVLELEFR